MANVELMWVSMTLQRQVIVMEKTDSGFNWYSNITPLSVEWLWYPYFPMGKISIVQGDPGSGKSLLMIDTIARVTTGRPLLDGKTHEPINVIYQCSEDGLEDTIRPRLERAGADCSRVAYINEDICNLTLDDEMIRQTILGVNASLLVIDPFQAYLGDSDLYNVTGMRRVMKKIGVWATAFDCAIILVGHLNKKTGQKELYRGLGSVDVMAMARSVIQIEESDEDPRIRYMRHVKSSLASPGKKLAYCIDSGGTMKWISSEEKDIKEYDGNRQDPMVKKTETVAVLLVQMLSAGPRTATSILDAFAQKDISERTVNNVKKMMGIKSYRKNGQWFWKLSVNESGIYQEKDQEFIDEEV